MVAITAQDVERAVRGGDTERSQTKSAAQIDGEVGDGVVKVRSEGHGIYRAPRTRLADAALSGAE
jgi:hypothetical protein